jgi:hypothetical protein
MTHLTPLEFLAFLTGAIALVGAVFFLGGRAWERAATIITPAADEGDAIAAWLHDMGGGDTPPPARPVLALAPPPADLPAPPATMPPPGPVRSYSALAAWTLERDTSRDADTSVTKLTARIVAGMAYREQIDHVAAGILARTRDTLNGDQAA